MFRLVYVIFSYILHRNEDPGFVYCGCIATLDNVVWPCLFTKHFRLHLLLTAINRSCVKHKVANFGSWEIQKLTPSLQALYCVYCVTKMNTRNTRLITRTSYPQFPYSSTYSYVWVFCCWTPCSISQNKRFQIKKKLLFGYVTIFLSCRGYVGKMRWEDVHKTVSNTLNWMKVLVA